MDVNTTLQPGDKGSKNLLRKYGEELAAVRYRYGKANSQHLKTVELIEEQSPWNPALRFTPFRKASVKINYDESAKFNKAMLSGSLSLAANCDANHHTTH